ncbi:hypothetical protein [Halomonas sp. hl-4]|uniref:hypothetical protein n=1 Tax=Halomonas sp. hl-4 TaxID=1761789 RepID=UPI000BB97CBA|nr:hypothetical protein [Halomonas sp. hl-4]SNY95546.1 hypothetical protein SAMN04488142_0046 [Halomonas sp. hl-4]
MITISSKAGQRMARAASRMERMGGEIKAGEKPGEKPGEVYMQMILDEWDAATGVVADELIAGRHHEAEGD